MHTTHKSKPVELHEMLLFKLPNVIYAQFIYKGNGRFDFKVCTFEGMCMLYTVYHIVCLTMKVCGPRSQIQMEFYIPKCHKTLNHTFP